MFKTLFIAPLYNCFIFLVGITDGSVGWAIIILTLIIRALLYRVFAGSIKMQMGMQEIQGDLAEINKTYKDNPSEKAKRTAELFKLKKINPLSTFLGLFVQIVVFIGLYWALFRQGLPSIETSILYMRHHLSPRYFLVLIFLHHTIYYLRLSLQLHSM